MHVHTHRDKHTLSIHITYTYHFKVVCINYAYTYTHNALSVYDTNLNEDSILHTYVPDGGQWGHESLLF